MPGFIYLPCITTRIADSAATAKIFRCGRAPRIVPLTAIRPTLAFILGLLAIAVAVAIFIFPTAAVIVATRPVLISVALVPVAVATFPTTIIRTTALAGITPFIAAAITPVVPAAIAPVVTRTWAIPSGTRGRGVPVAA